MKVVNGCLCSIVFLGFLTWSGFLSGCSGDSMESSSLERSPIVHRVGTLPTVLNDALASWATVVAHTSENENNNFSALVVDMEEVNSDETLAYFKRMTARSIPVIIIGHGSTTLNTIIEEEAGVMLEEETLAVMVDEFQDDANLTHTKVISLPTLFGEAISPPRGYNEFSEAVMEYIETGETELLSEINANVAAVTRSDGGGLIPPKGSIYSVINKQTLMPFDIGGTAVCGDKHERPISSRGVASVSTTYYIYYACDTVDNGACIETDGGKGGFYIALQQNIAASPNDGEPIDQQDLPDSRGCYGPYQDYLSLGNTLTATHGGGEGYIYSMNKSIPSTLNQHESHQTTASESTSVGFNIGISSGGSGSAGISGNKSWSSSASVTMSISQWGINQISSLTRANSSWEFFQQLPYDYTAEQVGKQKDYSIPPNLSTKTAQFETFSLFYIDNENAELSQLSITNSLTLKMQLTLMTSFWPLPVYVTKRYENEDTYDFFVDICQRFPGICVSN